MNKEDKRKYLGNLIFLFYFLVATFFTIFPFILKIYTIPSFLLCVLGFIGIIFDYPRKLGDDWGNKLVV